MAYLKKKQKKTHSPWKRVPHEKDFFSRKGHLNLIFPKGGSRKQDHVDRHGKTIDSVLFPGLKEKSN